MRELPVDVFCTNTMPSRHERLGIDYETLRAERNELIWCCISAMGLDHPDVPGYDPVTQAMCGYMDLTGHADGPPLQCGPPLIDLKAGDEAYTQIIQALWERSETGKGKCIDISMAQVAVSWLHTFLPMLEMGNSAEELRRSGNEHRQFIPVNAYRTIDGYVYLAIGSDAQWSRFVRQPIFATLDQERFAGNEGRRKQQDRVTRIHRGVDREARPRKRWRRRWSPPRSRIRGSRRSRRSGNSRSCAQQHSGRWLRMVGRFACRLPRSAHLTSESVDRCLPFAPAYSGDSRSIFAEVGLSTVEIAELESKGVAARG